MASELDAYLLPALPVSMGRCHKPMAGTVWLRPMTLAAAVMDIVRSLAASGIHQVVIVNGHGGNFTLEVAARELNLAHPELTVLLPPMSLRSSGPPIFETAGMEVHAGESETSVMMAIDASLVGDDRVDYIPSVGREFLDYAFVGAISPEGVWGKPSLATREKGQRAFDARVHTLVAYVRETLDRVARLKGRPGAPSAAGPGAAGPRALAAGSAGARGPSATASMRGPPRSRSSAPARTPRSCRWPPSRPMVRTCPWAVTRSSWSRSRGEPRRCSGPGRISCRPSRSAARRTCAALRARRICRPTPCAWSCRTWRWRSTRRAFTGSR